MYGKNENFFFESIVTCFCGNKGGAGVKGTVAVDLLVKIMRTILSKLHY